MDIPSSIGLAAGTIAVLGFSWAVWKRSRKAVAQATQRLSDIEAALESKPQVVFRERSLCPAPGMPGGLCSVETGSRGILMSRKEGWCSVRLYGQTTVVECFITSLEEPE